MAEPKRSPGGHCLCVKQDAVASALKLRLLLLFAMKRWCAGLRSAALVCVCVCFLCSAGFTESSMSTSLRHLCKSACAWGYVLRGTMCLGPVVECMSHGNSMVNADGNGRLVSFPGIGSMYSTRDILAHAQHSMHSIGTALAACTALAVQSALKSCLSGHNPSLKAFNGVISFFKGLFKGVQSFF